MAKKYSADDIAKAKELLIISQRQKYSVYGYDKTQIDDVRRLLKNGEFVDFTKALETCHHTQRLSAIIHILRHEEGMPIVDWNPTPYGGSIYALYKYAPREVRDEWKFINNLTPDQIKNYNFNKKPKIAQIPGQMNLNI